MSEDDWGISDITIKIKEDAFTAVTVHISHARAWCKNSVDDVRVDNVHLLSNA